MIINNLILLNVFSLILLQQFEEYYNNPFHPVIVLKEKIRQFEQAYVKFISEKNIEKINFREILQFIKCLPIPLGKLFNIF